MVSYCRMCGLQIINIGHIRLARVIGGTTTTDIFIGDQNATSQQRVVFW